MTLHESVEITISEKKTKKDTKIIKLNTEIFIE